MSISMYDTLSKEAALGKHSVKGTYQLACVIVHFTQSTARSRY